MKHLGIISQPQDLVTLEVLRSLSTKWSFGAGEPNAAAGALGEYYVAADNKLWVKGASAWTYTGVQLGSPANVDEKAVLVDADVISIGDSANSMQMRRATIADFKAQFLSTALADAAASPDLPAAAALSWQSIAQTLRNGLKWLTTRFNASGQLAPAYGGTGTDNLASLPISTATQAALDGTVKTSGNQSVAGSKSWSETQYVLGDSRTVYGPNSNWGASFVLGGNPQNVPDGLMASWGTTNGNAHADSASGDFTFYINYYRGTGGLIIGAGDASNIYGRWNSDGISIVFGGLRQGPLAPRTAKKELSGKLPEVGVDVSVATLGVPIDNVRSISAWCNPVVTGAIRIPPGHLQSPVYGPEKQFLYAVYPNTDGTIHAQVHPDGSGVAGSPVIFLVEYIVD